MAKNKVSPFSNYAKRGEGGLGYLVGPFYVKGGGGKKWLIFCVITKWMPLKIILMLFLSRVNFFRAASPIWNSRVTAVVMHNFKPSIGASLITIFVNAH